MMEENKSKGIDQELHLAYEQAHYKLFKPLILFKIGEQNEALKNILAKHHCSFAFFITSYNPGSRICSLSENNKTHEALHQRIIKLTDTYYKGQSESPDGTWPVEKSFLILNITKKDAIHIAQAFKQLAIVMIDKKGKSELLWCNN